MAESFREPNAVMHREVDKDTVEVTLMCDGIELGPNGGCKNVKVTTDPSFDGDSEHEYADKLHVTVEVNRGKRTTNYRQVVKQLPGDIVLEECTYKFLKNKVVFTLKKRDERSWKPQLLANGLDQASSSDDSN